MSNWEQGDIHCADIEDPVKSRPVVIISRSDLNRGRDNIVVALVTRTVRKVPLEISVGEEEGLAKPSVISLGDIYTVKKNRLSSQKGGLSLEKMDQLREGLKLLFAIP